MDILSKIKEEIKKKSLDYSDDHETPIHGSFNERASFTDGANFLLPLLEKAIAQKNFYICCAYPTGEERNEALSLTDKQLLELLEKR